MLLGRTCMIYKCVLIYCAACMFYPLRIDALFPPPAFFLSHTGCLPLARAEVGRVRAKLAEEEQRNNTARARQIREVGAKLGCCCCSSASP